MNEHEKVGPKVNRTRRTLVVATSAVGAAAGVGVAVPFVASLWPSERAPAAGAPGGLDPSRIAPGELAGVEGGGEARWGGGRDEGDDGGAEEGGAAPPRPPTQGFPAAQKTPE